VPEMHQEQAVKKANAETKNFWSLTSFQGYGPIQLWSRKSLDSSG
jgi:hypothetical protein